MELVLKVSVEEGQLLIAGLQELPHKVSHNLIYKVKAQGDEQIAAEKEKESDKGKEK